MKKKVLVAASVASMIGQFNMPNIHLLLEMGCEVHAACNFKKGSTCDRQSIEKLRQSLHKLHVTCHQWDCPRNVTNAAACVKAYVQITELLKQQRFCLIHCHSPVGGALARLAAHREKIPVIYTAHGFHFYKGAPLRNWLLYYPAELLLSYWTDMLITVNKEDGRFARQHLHAAHTQLIPGVGIDTRFFSKQNHPIQRQAFCRRHGIPEDAQILLSVGELSRRKNHQVAVTALAQLMHKNVYYIILGQGKERTALLRQAEQLGVRGRMRLMGYREDTELFYRHADVFVFPSLQEGMPAALMEAMAAGLPCVVSDIRGNRELIHKNGGGRFASDDAEQLCMLLDALLSDQSRREACGIYNQHCIQKFDLAAVCQTMKNIYAFMEQEAASRAAAAETCSVPLSQNGNVRWKKRKK